MTVNLHKGTSLLDWAIRWQTRSHYSHASITLDTGETIEAVMPRVRSIYTLPAGQTIDRYEIATTVMQRLVLGTWLRSQIGKPYDRTMVLRFITRDQDCRADSGKWFCSELVFAAFQVVGINLLERIEPWAVSPGLLSLSPLLKPIAQPSTGNPS